jgi:acetyltransferase-like isoleucine patch superfamily enzyme
MHDFLSKLFGFFFRGIAAIYDAAINFQYSSVVKLGGGSRFYRQASVYNLQHDKAKIRIGSNTHIRGEILVFPYGGDIQIGNACYIGEGTRIWSGEKIVMGNHVAIAHNVNIADFAHESDYLERALEIEKICSKGHPAIKGNIPTAPIIIEDYVAIYPNVCIVRGVRIGEGAVISAGSVVLSNVQPFMLMMGNPARPMKNLKN